MFTGSIYLADYQYEWKSDSMHYEIIENQAVPKEEMKRVRYGTELIIEKNKVIKVHEYNYGKRISEIRLIPFSYNFNKVEVKHRIPYAVQVADNSLSHLGGKIPDNFKVPKFNDEISFQYFGFISKEEFPSNILDFDLHLVAPIYDNFNELFLDYSDPLAPKIIEGEKSYFSKTFDKTNSFSVITFERTPIKFNDKDGLTNSSSMGNTGVPIWLQNPSYPKCPISGEKMEFLVSFRMADSKHQIPRKTINFKPDEGFESYFENLEFWTSGDIYIFINRKLKIVCYFIQTT